MSFKNTFHKIVIMDRQNSRNSVGTNEGLLLFRKEVIRSLGFVTNVKYSNRISKYNLKFPEWNIYL